MRLKIIKLENAYTYTLSHFLAEVVYTPEFWIKSFLKVFATKFTTSRFEGFKQKEIFVNLIIPTPFYKNQSKKY